MNVYLLHKLKPEEHTKHFLCPQFFTIPASPNVGYRVVADDKTRAGTEENKTSMQAGEMLGWGDSQCVAEGVVWFQYKSPLKA